MKQCIMCGNKAEDSSKVCENCGYSFVKLFPPLNGFLDDEEMGKEDGAADLDRKEESKKEADSSFIDLSEEQEKSAGAENSVSASEESAEDYETVSEKTTGDFAPASEKPTRDFVPASEESASEENSASASEAQTEDFSPASEDPVPEEDFAASLDKMVSSQVSAPDSEKSVTEEQLAEVFQEENRKCEERKVRKMKSEPQIYGQPDGSAPQNYEQQGMVRRNVQGQPVNPVNRPQPEMPNGRPQRRPVNGQMQGQPANMPQGRPANAPQQSRPMNGQPQSRPVSGQPQGRPMNGYPVNGQPQSRSMNGQPLGRPVNVSQQRRPMMPGTPAQTRQVSEVSRKMLRSPLFFLIVLLNTICFVSSIAAIFMNQLNYSQAARMIRQINLPGQLAGYTNTVISILSKLDSGMIAANLALRLPALLFCIGLWLVFFIALTSRGDRMSGLGFGFVKTRVIIHMIAAFAVMLVTLVISVALTIAAWKAGKTAVMIVAVMVLVFAIIIVMMVIMYYFAFLATLKTVRINADQGESYGRASVYVAVLHIILSLPGIVEILSGIVNDEITGIVTGGTKLAWMILFALWILLYRGKLAKAEGEDY